MESEKLTIGTAPNGQTAIRGEGGRHVATLEAGSQAIRDADARALVAGAAALNVLAKLQAMQNGGGDAMARHAHEIRAALRQAGRLPYNREEG